MKKQDNAKKQEALAKKQEAKARKLEAKNKKKQEKKEAKARKKKEKQAKKNNEEKQAAKAKKQEEKKAAKAKKQEAKAKKLEAKKAAKAKKQQAKAAKKKNKGAAENGEEQAKRKLNLKVVIPLVVLLLAGGAAGAFFFLRGGEELQPPTAYAIAGESTIVLDGFLEEGGKITAINVLLPEGTEEDSEEENDKDSDKDEDKEEDEKEEENSGSEEEPLLPVDAVATYDYTGVTPAALQQYVEALLAEDEGFVLVDDSYKAWPDEERPVFVEETSEEDGEEDEEENKDKEEDKDEKEDKGPQLVEGTALLARESSQEGRLFQLRLTWTAEGGCVVEVSCPEAAFPQEPMLNSTGALDYIKGQKPSTLGLPGESMADYNIYNQDGSVMVDGKVYRKFYVYELDEVTQTNAYVGEFLISGDGRTIYKRDGLTGELEKVK